MSEPRTEILDYGDFTQYRRRRRRRRILIFSILAVTVLAAAGISRSTLFVNIRLTYWQQQCADYNNQNLPVWAGNANSLDPFVLRDNYVTSYSFGSVNVSGFALWPRCWQNLLHVLGKEGCFLPASFFDSHSWPIVFLHDRISPAGTRRIICMEMRPNIDHGQLCSLDCAVITPATFSSPPHATASVALWIPGWWDEGVRKAKLKLAQPDPNDSSHFVFQYEQNCPPNGNPHYLVNDNNFHRAENQTQNFLYTVDGWLRDNGTVDLKFRGAQPITS